ncbi:MAG TPA: ABC transporter ATP-binding protein [Thermoanaerobaculia bacterium]|nr:ABC transporter ATP-binding protein [Thermoanaerobaculia bacterium]
MIKLQSVTKTYETAAGAFPAVRGVDLEVARGEFLAVVGRSGSGKSTLLNLLGGIDSASGGKVEVAGADIGRMRPDALAAWRGRTIGFVFQFFQLLPGLTAAENVMLPMDFLGAVPARDRRGRAIGLLEKVGVAREGDRLPASLSGGQQQRVAIARALANDPAILLADEPTGNLDSATAGEVLGLLRGLADAGKTVVVATHERDIRGIADRVVELADGTVASDSRRPAVPLEGSAG